MRRSSKGSFLLLFAIAVLLVGTPSREIRGHKAVTSRYTYNADVFPILREKCGRCHVEGGPAPMGLMQWNDGPNSATPWAESIRLSIVGEQMPPWFVDPKGPAIRGGFGLDSLESDKLLTWTTGGTPEGDLTRKPERVSYQLRWAGGNPDVKVQMESEYVMPVGENETTKTFLLQTGLSGDRWLRAVDLMPGAPEIVRNAVISVENGATLAVWVPGDNLVPAPTGTAFRLPAGAKLQLQIHYKKQWQNEGKSFKDRSTVGLYFATAPATPREIRSWTLEAGAAKEPSTFSGALPAKARVVAVRPSLDKVYGSLTVQATTPAGAKVTLLKLRGPRPEWRRRYWLASPVDLPAGSRVEVLLKPSASYVDLTGAGLLKTYPLEVALDFTP